MTTNTDKSMTEILEQIEFLFEKYSLERRATTQPYLLDKVIETVKGYQYQPDDDLIRETLMEHVGSTPVIATALFPYLEDNEVNIGDSLTMLAIHDIGELVTGDEITFTKKASAKDPEYDAALKLLDPIYHQAYDEVETQTGKSAQFAKAVDKITPDIMDYLTPADVTIWRYKHFVGIEPDEIIDMIVKHKRPYMLWNPFMSQFHTHLIEQLRIKLNV